MAMNYGVKIRKLELKITISTGSDSRIVVLGYGKGAAKNFSEGLKFKSFFIFDAQSLKVFVLVIYPNIQPAKRYLNIKDRDGYHNA